MPFICSLMGVQSSGDKDLLKIQIFNLLAPNIRYFFIDKK